MASPTLLQKLAAYVPTPVVQEIYQQTKPLETPSARRFPAVILFTDISGFTYLSELLSKAGPTGAEELTSLINRYFTQMIATIESYHGQVVKFSGDALTVLFPSIDISIAESLRLAGECSLAMQAKMSDFTKIETSRGEIASLSMKVAIGVGEILACSVGGALGRWEYLVAGDPIVQVAMAEHEARPEQIILSPQAWVEAQQFFEGLVLPNQFVVLKKAHTSQSLTVPFEIDWSKLSPEHRILAERALQHYVPGAVKVRLNEQAEWLAELRRMTIMFVEIGGVNYQAKSALNQLQSFIQAVQELVYSFEGALNKVAVDDKGTVLLLLFGAPPFSHEDDTTRAVACALELKRVAENQNLQVSIGIAEGQIFAGPVGAPNRREYTVIGDQVNLAARLMQHGGVGSIIISERVKERAGPHFIVDNLGHIPIKGKSKTISAYAVQGEQDAEDEFVIRYLLNEDHLLGREKELTTLRQIAQKAEDKKFQILFIQGELGVGKSRLATELVREWVMGGGVGYGSKCVSYGRQVPYQAWREVLTAVHGLNVGLNSERQLERLIRGIADLPDPPNQPNYWANRLPLLAEALNIDAPDNKFTRDITGQLRRNNTFALIEAILRRQAERHRLLILLEDIQWADELSLSLIEHLTTTLTDTPVLLVLAHRPIDSSRWSKFHEIRDLPYSHTIELEPLPTADSDKLLKLLLDNQPLPQATIDILLSRAQGNPFFLQEIARTVLNAIPDEAEANELTPDQINLSELPDTIQDVILSRVDRLTEEAAKLTLKIASVIGTQFPRNLLFEIHPMSDRARYDIAAHLDKLEAEKLLRLESPAPKWEYVFHNVVTQEVVYEGLLLAQRRQLHNAVGVILEKTSPDDIEQLAYHYSRSLDTEKGIYYLAIAAQKSEREYANQAAIDYYSAILELFTIPQKNGRARGIISTEYWDFLRSRAKLYNLIGLRDEEIEDLGTLGIISEALSDDYRRALCSQQWAYLYGTTGNYREGIKQIERCVELAQNVENERLLGEGYNYWGRLLYMCHEYETAHQYLQHALLIAQRNHDKNAQSECLHSLGLVAYYQTDYEVALYFYNEAIDLRQEQDNQVGLADSLSKLGQVYYRMGDYAQAIHTMKKSLKLHLAIGDKGGEAYTRHNFGYIYCTLGDYQRANRYLEKALTLHQAVGDRRGEGLSLYHLGLLHTRLQEYQTAQIYLKESLAILRELDDPWALADALTYYGWTLYCNRSYEKAEERLVEALQLQRALQQEGNVTEIKAHLGNIALAQNDLILAEVYAQEIMTYLDEHNWHGIEHPGLVYLSIYNILTESQQTTSAEAILTQAHTYLKGQLKNIDSDRLQQDYLNKIPEHKTIQQLINALR